MNDELEMGLVESVTHAMRQGGPFMMPLAGLAALATLLGLGFLAVTLVRKRGATAFGLVLLGLVGATFVVDAAGEAVEVRRARASLEDFDEQQRTPTMEKLMASGQLRLRDAALTGAVAPTFLACVLLSLGLSRSRRFEAHDVRA